MFIPRSPVPTRRSPVRAVAASFAVSVAAVLLLFPAALRAQVGHRPDQSPYEDVKLGQSLSVSAGWFAFKRDPAGVAPQAAPYGSVRYDVSVGGPASLYARYAIATTNRTLYAPGAVAAARKTGEPGVAMHVMDVGLDMGLTGRKTWHHIIPAVSGGVGIVSDFAQVDSGGYQFGVKFAISYGLGVRYVRSSGLRFRVDATNYLWQYEYPDRYFVAASDGTSILTDTRQRSSWRGNWGLTAGIAYPIFK